MDIAQHGVHSVIITDLMLYATTGHSAILVNPWYALLFFVIGILPDLSGWIDGKIRGEQYRWDGAYKFFHYDILNNVWYFVLCNIVAPGIMTHILIDMFWHKPEGGWIEKGVLYNWIGWGITLIVGCVS